MPQGFAVSHSPSLRSLLISQELHFLLPAGFLHSAGKMAAYILASSSSDAKSSKQGSSVLAQNEETPGEGLIGLAWVKLAGFGQWGSVIGQIGVTCLFLAMGLSVGWDSLAPSGEEED